MAQSEDRSLIFWLRQISSWTQPLTRRKTFFTPAQAEQPAGRFIEDKAPCLFLAQ
jgi:hypothetical protein